MSKRGVTLIEAIIYIAILGMIGTVMVEVVLRLSSLGSRQSAEVSAVSSLRSALWAIQTQIHEAESIDLQRSVFNRHPGVLTLRMADPATNPTVIDLSDTGVLQLRQNNDPPIPITDAGSPVSALLFFDRTVSTTRRQIEFVVNIGTLTATSSASLR